ncbi:unnamed protein product [Rhizophagus irregularis]|nr:unnamed protein product [Rhizophagus irregularis]
MRYSTGFGIFKKALNLAISLNCDDELLVTDLLVVQKRGTSFKWLKSSTESNNNTVRKYKKQALTSLDENLQFKSSKFIEIHNNSVAVDKENETLIDTQLQDEDSANKYKCRVYGSFRYNACNKRKCSQQNSL